MPHIDHWNVEIYFFAQKTIDDTEYYIVGVEGAH